MHFGDMRLKLKFFFHQVVAFSLLFEHIVPELLDLMIVKLLQVLLRLKVFPSHAVY